VLATEKDGIGKMPMSLRTHRFPGLVVTAHEFDVPLDYAQPTGEQITVFAREVVAAGKEDAGLPWLVYFQGGPGFDAPRPLDNSGWLKRALQDYRVLLLDQRGTGLSTPVTAQTLARFSTPQEQADYLKQFRADNIVRDAELIRKTLLGEDGRWSILGQSFGGFCVTHYLSAAPEGLREAFITGGLPPLERHVDDVYRATYLRVLQKNRLYYERYPDDARRVQEIAGYLQRHRVYLPGGGRLTARRFQQIGMGFGASDGLERVHYLLETAFVRGRRDQELSYIFLQGVEQLQSFDTNPIFAILHEAIYCQQFASNWSAERVRDAFPEFEIEPNRPVYFTGEMVYPWMFEDFAQLQPLSAAAENLASYDGWPRLYNIARLRANTVPTVAVLYYDDMYVERQYSEETAGNIAGIKVWITNEYQHNGLRADGERVLGRLIAMVRGEA
jgi:pimeloyl-ACP methyl ester carboxylesterase